MCPFITFYKIRRDTNSRVAKNCRGHCHCDSRPFTVYVQYDYSFVSRSGERERKENAKYTTDYSILCIYMNKKPSRSSAIGTTTKWEIDLSRTLQDFKTFYFSIISHVFINRYANNDYDNNWADMILWYLFHCPWFPSTMVFSTMVNNGSDWFFFFPSWWRPWQPLSKRVSTSCEMLNAFRVD